MANNLIKDDINIKKFDLPVLFLTEQQIIDIKIKAFIRFIKIEIEGDFATVKLQYKIQGLYCSSYYKLENCEWKSIQSKFVEN